MSSSPPRLFPWQVCFVVDDIVEAASEGSRRFSQGAGPTGHEAGHDDSVPVVEVDRATIVTDDMARALAFYSAAFDWEDVHPATHTLRRGGQEVRHARATGRAGHLDLELVEGRPGDPDPYGAHLVRGDHGLVHAGGCALPGGVDPEYEWLETGERFGLHDWAGGAGTLQLRSA